MIVRINGKEEEIDTKININELVLRKGLSPGSIVVEHNLRIVPKEEWPKVVLQENDELELIRFMGGG